MTLTSTQAEGKDGDNFINIEDIVVPCVSFIIFFLSFFLLSPLRWLSHRSGRQPKTYVKISGCNYSF
jgi:hypothetical protein